MEFNLPDGDLPLRPEVIKEDLLERIVNMQLTEDEMGYIIGAFINLEPSKLTVVLNDVEDKRNR